MGYRININPAALMQAADSVDQYIETHKRYMSMGTQAVNQLSNNWQGKDANLYINHWHKISDSSSVSGRMLHSMNEYSQWLRYAAHTYRLAQESAIESAYGIPVL